MSEPDIYASAFIKTFLMRVMLHDGCLKHSKVKTIALYCVSFGPASKHLCKHCEQIFFDCIIIHELLESEFASVHNYYEWIWSRARRMEMGIWNTNCTSANDFSCSVTNISSLTIRDNWINVSLKTKSSYKCCLTSNITIHTCLNEITEVEPSYAEF